jgi:hypothetical protein
MKRIKKWKLKRLFNKKAMGILDFSIVGSATEWKSFFLLLSIIKFLCDFFSLLCCERRRRKRRKKAMKNCEKAENPSSPRVGAYVEREKKLSKRCSVFPFSFKSMCCMSYELFNCFLKHYIFIKNKMNGRRIDMCVLWKFLSSSHTRMKALLLLKLLLLLHSVHSDVCSKITVC